MCDCKKIVNVQIVNPSTIIEFAEDVTLLTGVSTTFNTLGLTVGSYIVTFNAEIELKSDDLFRTVSLVNSVPQTNNSANRRFEDPSVEASYTKIINYTHTTKVDVLTNGHTVGFNLKLFTYDGVARGSVVTTTKIS